VCSQCIDRRFGILAGGAEGYDPVSQYKLDIFTQSRPKDEDKIMLAAYLERANRVKELRDGADLLQAFPEVRRVLPYLGLDAGRGADRVLDLYRRHAEEVNAGVDVMLARYARALRERTLPGDCLLWTVYAPHSVNVLPAVQPMATASEPTKVNGHEVTHLFRQAGDYWDVVFEGNTAFHLKDTFGARYLDRLLHNPNKAIRALDLEGEIRVEKTAVRAQNSIQAATDRQSLLEYRNEVEELEAELEEAKATDNEAAVERLEKEIQDVKAAMGKKGNISGDAGERARDNVRKAVEAVVKSLTKKGSAEKAFAKHVSQCVKLGYDVMYVNPQGTIWE
jgi:hypothetical protein